VANLAMETTRSLTTKQTKPQPELTVAGGCGGCGDGDGDSGGGVGGGGGGGGVEGAAGRQ
jgi:hypothetical protein